MGFSSRSTLAVYGPLRIVSVPREASTPYPCLTLSQWPDCDPQVPQGLGPPRFASIELRFAPPVVKALPEKGGYRWATWRGIFLLQIDTPSMFLCTSKVLAV
jgi:hypothetical protein